VLIENEGNGRMTRTMTETVIAGGWGDSRGDSRLRTSHCLKSLRVRGNGQKLKPLPIYQRAPRRNGELDGPRAMPRLIMENGRSD